MAKMAPEDWIDEIDNALAYRELFAKEASWNKTEMNFLNDSGGDAVVGPNLVYSLGDSLLSSLTVPNPEFMVTAERRLGIDKAPIIESLDNHLIRKLRMKRYVDRALLLWFLYGKAILKIGYDSEFGWSPFYDIGQGNNMLGMSFTQFDKKGHRIESPDTQPGWPWLRPVPPHDFVVPWGTVFLEDAPWAAHRFVRHIDSLKADAKYINTTRLQGKMTMEDFMTSYLSVMSKKQQARLRGIAEHNKKPDFVECWEIRDRLTGEILVVTRDYPRYLRKANDALQVACGMPFVVADMSPHPRSFWSTPPAYYIGQMQKTQRDISTQAEKQRRISVLKFLCRKGALSSTNLSRLLSSDVGAAEEVETTYPFSEIIQPLKTGSDVDIFAAQSEINRRDAREGIGLSRNQMGEPLGTPGRRTTSAEVRSVSAGSGIRMDKRQEGVIGFYVDAIEKVNRLCFEYWQTPREVMQDEGSVIVTGPMLKGDYLYDVSLSTKRRLSRAQRKVEALMMIAQIAPFLQGSDIKALYSYLSDAVSDPAFERVLAPLTGKMAAPQGTPQGPQGSQATGGR